MILLSVFTLIGYDVSARTLFLPDKCNFDAKFACLDHLASPDNNGIRFLLRNDFDNFVSVENMKMEVESYPRVSCNIIPGTVDQWAPKETRVFNFSDCRPAEIFSDVGKKSFFITFDYTLKGVSENPIMVKGEIFTGEPSYDYQPSLLDRILAGYLAFLPFLLFIIIVGIVIFLAYDRFFNKKIINKKKWKAGSS